MPPWAAAEGVARGGRKTRLCKFERGSETRRASSEAPGSPPHKGHEEIARLRCPVPYRVEVRPNKTPGSRLGGRV